MGCGLLFSAVSAPLASADDSGFNISVMGGQAIFDKDRELEDDTFFSIDLGYDFSERWGMEFGYVSAEAEFEDFNESVDLEQFRLDGLYYFGENNFKPYLVAGIGDQSWSLDGFDDIQSTFVNAGAGFKYYFNPHVALRGDARLVNSLDEEMTDYLVGLGLLVKFGGESKPSPKPVAPVAVAEKDSDRDGVMDSQDQCPATPMGTSVDAKGCAIDNDLDKDGVANALDKCPDTAAGAKVDANGCYLTLKENVTVSLAVNFASNSDKVLDGAYDEVKKVADFMRQYPQTEVVFEGHTDDSGAAEYNRQLSQRRANAVAQMLIQDFNIDRSRVTAIGYGEEKPLVDNSTPANRAKNRRVVAVVSATVETTQQ
ncbi:Outer membrane porin F [Thalassocella blandensis]|nr:Outer membrane porin F [Thalassocella blandensis]